MIGDIYTMAYKTNAIHEIASSTIRYHQAITYNVYIKDCVSVDICDFEARNKSAGLREAYILCDYANAPIN